MPDPQPTRAAEQEITNSLADPAATTGGPGTPTHADTPTSVAAQRYELGTEIARGGMGAVYRATDTAFARDVAVKVLLDKYAPTSGTARRFADEARITGQLQHPNIPAVHDLGTLPDGRPFLAMKLIKGNTLDALLKARTDPSAERGRFVAVFEQVCQAVAYAHAHKVIHRDLKPGNVMVGSYGEVQVMDWGLAKVLGTRDAELTDPDETAAPTAVQSIRQTDSAFTQAGSVLGTPAYMPPEQAVGAINKVDARSDVFGLGAILTVILTGKPPFAASSVETTRVMAAQGNVEECFARLDACGADPELVTLCKRCLSKKPGDRPADAGAVARAVAALRAAADERARQAELDRVKAEGDKVAAELRVEGERQKAEEQRRRRRAQLALACAVLLLAVAGTFGTVVASLWRTAETQRDTADAARVEAIEQKRLADSARGDAVQAQVAETAARQQVEFEREKLAVFEYGGTTRVAHQEWRDGQLVAMRALLDGTDSKLRNWEWRYLNRLCDTLLLTLKGHSAPVNAAAFSPDGTRIVTASGEQFSGVVPVAKVWDAKTGAELLTLKGHTESVWSAAFSPDGTRIVTFSLDETKVWDASPVKRETRLEQKMSGVLGKK